MKKKLLLMIIIIFLSLNIVLIFVSKKVYSHFDSKTMDDLEYSVVESSVEGDEYSKYMFSDFHSLKDLENKSDVIVKVKVIDKKYYQEDVLANVEILKTYKGDCDEKITIAEPVKVNNYHPRASCMEGYVPMNEGEEYMLFLNKTDKDNMYIFVSDIYSHFKLNKTTKIMNFDDSKIHKMNDLKDFDYIYIYGTMGDSYDILTKDDKMKTIDTKELTNTYRKIHAECYEKYAKN